MKRRFLKIPNRVGQVSRKLNRVGKFAKISNHEYFRRKIQTNAFT